MVAFNILQQPIIDLTDILKREHEAAEKCNIRFKEFYERKNRKDIDNCHYKRESLNNCYLKNRIPDYIRIEFHNPSASGAYLFIEELA